MENTRTKKTRNYCIISHTHWDREWYLPLENFRMRLVDLIDHLLEILDTDPDYRFHLDAQTIVLEDYLEIRPARRELLKKHIRDGRILVGPWYVQNDFHLTSGEATVRNLLIGTAIAEDFGGCMEVGYAADQFGLCSQLPQILVRYGLDSCIFGRGFGRGDSQFYWQTEDGSRVLCEHMFAWYNNAQRLSADPEGALSLIRSRGQACIDRGKTENCLLMNGVDHLEAQEDLTEILETIRPLLNAEEAVFQDTFPEYIRRTKDEIAARNLQLTTYTGEFRDLGAGNVLTGTLSSRVYLKQYNARLQAMLEKTLEPLYAGAEMMGLGCFPKEYLTYLWKTLIQNHPHDSICGCSVDAVHNHMMDRFVRIEENITDLTERGNSLVLSHLDRTGLDEKEYLLLWTNPSQLPYRGVMEAVADIPVEEDTGCFTLRDSRGKNVPFTVAKIEKNVNIQILSPINLPGSRFVNRYTLRCRPGTLGGFSHKTLILTPVAGELSVTPARKKSAYFMENEHLKVRIHRNGTLDLTDKKTGAVYGGLLLLEDTADTGTAYNYNDAAEKETVTSENVRAKAELLEDDGLVQRRRISFAMKLNRAVGSGTVLCETVLTLAKGDAVLGVEMRVDNRCIRHRLRALFPTGIRSDVNYAGQPYDVVVRPQVSPYPDDKTHPNTDFCGIEDGVRGFALFNEGLYEYEHMTGADDGTLALTLLRAVGRITGGFAEEGALAKEWIAPGAQCLGKQTYRFALYPYGGDRVAARVAARAGQFTAMPYAVCQSVDPNKFVGGRPFVQGPGMPDLFYRPMPYAEVVVPLDGTLFAADNPNLVLTAMKGSEAMDGCQILRFYNSTSEKQACKLRFTGRLVLAEETDLRERTVRPLTVVRGHEISVDALPKQIVTLKVRVK